MNWIADLALIPSLAAAVTAGLLVVLDDRRFTLAILAVQYLLAAWLAAAALPLGVAAAKLAGGLLACVVLGVSAAGIGWRAADRPGALPTAPTFRWIAVLLVAIVAFALGRGGWGAIPSLQPKVALGALFLLALGMLQIGISEDTLRVGVGILTLLSGFEVAYAAVEPALAVVALLASVHLGVALVVSYLMVGLRGAAGKGGED